MLIFGGVFRSKKQQLFVLGFFSYNVKIFIDTFIQNNLIIIFIFFFYWFLSFYRFTQNFTFNPKLTPSSPGHLQGTWSLKQPKKINNNNNILFCFDFICTECIEEKNTTHLLQRAKLCRIDRKSMKKYECLATF